VQLQQKISSIEVLNSQKFIALKTEIEAYKQFCNKVGLGVDTAFAWLENTVVPDDFTVGCLNSIAPNEAKLTKRKQRHKKAWGLKNDFKTKIWGHWLDLVNYQ
jgi:hypothetical protein